MIGTSLAVQWLRFCDSTEGLQIQPLEEELRSHMVPHIALQGKKKKPSSSAQTRPAVKNEGKESEKIIYGTESFCCTPETLQISHTSIKCLIKNIKINKNF